MEAVPMEQVFEAVLKAGVVIGHDGCAIPGDVGDVMPDQCICDGSGHAEVVFEGEVIARPVCQVCARG